MYVSGYMCQSGQGSKFFRWYSLGVAFRFFMQSFHKAFQQFRQVQGSSYREVSYGGNALSINPSIAPVNKADTFFDLFDVFVNKEAATGIGPAAFTRGAEWSVAGDSAYVLDTSNDAFRWTLRMGRFFKEANLTLNYEVGEGTFSTIQGNDIEDVTVFSVTARVSQVKAEKVTPTPGLPTGAIFFRGYLSSAVDIPLNKRLNAVLSNVSGDVNGTVTLYPITQSNQAQPDITGAFILDGSDW